MKQEWTAKEIAEILKISRQAIIKRSSKEKWPNQKKRNSKGGGITKAFFLPQLPSDIQKNIILKSENLTSPEELSELAPEAQLEAYRKMMPAGQFSFSSSDKRKDLLDPQQKLPFKINPTESKPFSISPDILQDDRVGDLVQIIQEAENVPPGYKKTKWIQIVAIKYDKNPATIYRYLKKHERSGLAGLKHRKSTRGQTRSWTPEAVDFWIGLCLKKEHRKISKEALYECLKIEASKKGWSIGGYRSALWWFDKRVTPQLLALQRGGVRALDYTLPPICRDYSDLKPFEILVGDQHRFDFWVVDDETGEVFRPEGYFWQDLRTRCFYGGAIANRYDSHLMGLALRIGMRRFGSFGTIYTDHGKPEESKYIMGILKEMRALGLSIEETLDIPADISAADPEEMVCRIAFPNEHRKAIVRNAKAKMIESTNRALENILRNQVKMPGHTKRLNAPQEEQEVDHKEIKKLAASGKLRTFREFVLAVYKGMDFYNGQKAHRGVLNEWLWNPKPKKATPMQCLEMCYAQDGWRPTSLPEDAIEMAFLPREQRAIDRGRITFNKERYEHDALMELSGRRVEIRFDPLDPSWILVFSRGEFLCKAGLTEYSSMRDRDLAKRKMAEKARQRKIFIEHYREITSRAPDFREYSTVPAAERAAAIIGKAKRESLEKKTQEAEFYRERSANELKAEIEAIERGAREMEAARLRGSASSLPARPAFFIDDFKRFEWCMIYEIAGGELREDDRLFKERYWSGKLTEGGRQYWEERTRFEAESREASRQKAAETGEK